MTLQDGDLVTLNDGQIHAEVVGRTQHGYDVVRLMDYQVVRHVPREELQPVG
jgi:hypothetical protein